MIPCPADDQLRLLLDEQVAADVAAPLVQHTDECPTCQERLGHLLADSLVDKLTAVPIPLPVRCATSLRRRLQDLLVAAKTLPEGATVAYVVERAPLTTVASVTVPGYEVLEVLGRGGMAVVYKARQVSLNRLVALKMILSGAHADSAEVARFHTEAQAVASLHHPHIVQIYEVGEHNHFPFFSLELMEGGNLDRKVAGAPQPPKEAARLMEVLARAMHYAHERGIVHRDLKPANVLLTADGTPKIADFGLAKRQLSADPQPEGEWTQTGAILGTPSYMAPEQAEGHGKTASPLADVYALGAMLYELLTGRPPFRGTSTLETLRQVRCDDPIAPARLQPQVPRDLETICLKCLHKGPERRYPSAAALADDLHRFLANEPIQARPTSLWEHAVKWAKRRPTKAAVFLSAALATLLLVAGVFLHSIRLQSERDYAERNLQRARRAVEAMLTEVAEEHLAYEPHMEENRRVLLEKALKFYQELREEKRTDPTIRIDSALAAQRVGDILRLLGRFEQAKDAYLEAIDLLAPVAADASPDRHRRGLRARSQQALANCYNFLGEVLRQTNHPQEAADGYRKALGTQDELVLQFPDDPQYRMERARTHYNLGILWKDTNQLAEAERSLGQAVTDLGPLVARYPDVPQYRQHLARSYLNLGTLLRQTGRPQAAMDRYQQAITLLQELTRNVPANPDYRHELGVARNNLGNVLVKVPPLAAQDDPEGEHTAAVQLFTELVRDFPKVPVYRQELANSYNSLGYVLATKCRLPAPSCGVSMAGCAASPRAASFPVVAALLAGNARKLPEAQRAFEQAKDALILLVAEHKDMPQYEGDLGMAQGNLGWVLAEQQKWLEARPSLDDGIAILRKVVQASSPVPAYRDALRNQYQTLAETALQLRDHAAAAKAATALPQVFGDRGVDYYYAACFLARCLPLTNQRELQQDYARRAIERLRAAAIRGVPRDQRLPDLEKTILIPLGPDAVVALAALDTRGTP
jgi:serine/threonine protein kinase